MKSVVKIIKSLHADSHTLNAMFLGYFILLAVTATMIVNSHHAQDDTMAKLKVTSEQVHTN